MDPRQLMQRRDVAETEDRLFDLCYLVDDPLHPVSAARAKDHIHALILQRFVQVRQPFLVRTGETSVRVTCVRALAHLITPRA